jgi:hypothetical protein
VPLELVGDVRDREIEGARIGTYFGSMPRSISTASTETLGTSMLSASGAPFLS